MEILLLLALALLAAKSLTPGDTATMRGDVSVWLLGEDGSKQLHFEKKNLIVNGGKTIMAKLLGGDASYKNLEHITKIAFGSSNTAVSATQTALVAQQFEKAASVSYPVFNQVKFSTTMEDGEGGSYTYQELGLKSSATGILFSRLVISPITKSALYKIQVDWTISFQ